MVKSNVVVRALTPPAMCSVFFCGISCDSCLLTVVLVMRMTSLRVECKTKNETGIEDSKVLVSDSIPDAALPPELQLGRPLTEKKLEQIQKLLFKIERRMEDCHLRRKLTTDSPAVKHRTVLQTQYSEVEIVSNENQNCSINGRSNCTNGTRSEESNERSGSGSISWQVLLVILLVCIPVCFILGCLSYRFILSSSPESSSTTNDVVQTTSPPRQVVDRGLPVYDPTNRVVRWLEDPVQHQPQHPIPLVPEELQAYRMHMIQRAQAYGYNPLQVQIHQIQLLRGGGGGGFNPNESQLSWQLASY